MVKKVAVMRKWAVKRVGEFEWPTSGYGGAYWLSVGQRVSVTDAGRKALQEKTNAKSSS